MRVLLFVLGFLPFLFGGFMNWYMMTYPDTLPPFFLIAVIFLLLWCFLSFAFKRKGNSTKEILILLNFVAAVDLILLGVQELILHAYWMNAIGSWTQFYFLPLLNLGFGLTKWTPSVFFAYTASFLLMVGASSAGCKICSKIHK